MSDGPATPLPARSALIEVRCGSGGTAADRPLEPQPARPDHRQALQPPTGLAAPSAHFANSFLPVLTRFFAAPEASALPSLRGFLPEIGPQLGVIPSTASLEVPTCAGIPAVRAPLCVAARRRAAWPFPVPFPGSLSVASLTVAAGRLPAWERGFREPPIVGPTGSAA